MQNNPLKFKIAAAMIPGIGEVLAKKLIAYTGSVESIFQEKKQNLLKIPGIGEILADSIVSNRHLPELAEQEIEFIEKHDIQALFYLDPNYPERLKHCEDAPVVLYVKGKVDFGNPKSISIVGTRNATAYGKEACQQLIEDLVKLGHHPVIVSGLAYGIDIAAHKSALANGLQTIAVLGHGLNTIYPSAHRQVAKDICQQGALVSDFVSTTIIDPRNFVKRNRIIAGLADATIVIESGETGGALITADIANSYNRDVFAFPGRVNDKYSKGCNKLIRINKAALIESAKNLEYMLNWETSKKNKAVQRSLFPNLTGEESAILAHFQNSGSLSIDELGIATGLPVSKLSPLLLNLEFEGQIRSLPGKVYQLV